MKLARFALPVAFAACLFTAGCAHHPYYPPPPPPPPAAAPPLIQRAEQVGFRTGAADGASDRVNGFGYHPRRSPNFRSTPGYDPALGPFPPYRDAFRNAYQRGYDQGFRRP